MPFDMTGWKTASPKVLSFFFFVSPFDCFNTIMVELITLMCFSCPTGYTGATERVRLRSFRLQGTSYLGQSERTSLAFSFSQSCYLLEDVYAATRIETGDAVSKFCACDFPTSYCPPPPPPPPITRNFFPCFVVVMLSRAFHQLHFPGLLISYISRAFHQLYFTKLFISYVFPRFFAPKVICDLSSDWLRTVFSGAVIGCMVTVIFTCCFISGEELVINL